MVIFVPLFFLAFAFALYFGWGWGDCLSISSKIVHLCHKQRIDDIVADIKFLEEQNVSSEVMNYFKFRYQLVTSTPEEVDAIVAHLKEIKEQTNANGK